MKRVKWEIGPKDNRIVLAYVCEQCDGEAVVSIIGASFTEECSECTGDGYQLTKSGAEILAMVDTALIQKLRR